MPVQHNRNIIRVELFELLVEVCVFNTNAGISDFRPFKSLSPQAMTLMEYLIKTGSERVAQQCRENIYAVQTLKDFQYIDRDGKDQVGKRSRVLRAPSVHETESLQAHVRKHKKHRCYC